MKNFTTIITALLIGLLATNCDVREETKQPTACFEADRAEVKVGETVSFSSECSKEATLFQWDFGNNNTSVAVNPSHRFDEVGEHVVKLIVVNKNLRDEARTTIMVVEDKLPPEAGFEYTPTEPMVNQEIAFTNTSQNAESYEWAFGDGNQSSSTNTTHTYTQAGSYQVTLTSIMGTESDVETKTIVVTGAIDELIADFTYLTKTPITYELVYFTNTSENAESYEWDFGDGDTSSEENPFHYYISSGEYSVKLTAYRGSEVDEVSYTIKVYDELPTFDPTDYASKPIGGWDEYYVDGFDTDLGDWSVKDEGGVSAKIENGYYAIELSGTDGGWYFWTTGAEMPSSSYDYDMDVFLTVERDDSTYGDGLIWGLENENLDGNDFRLAHLDGGMWYSVGDPNYYWLETASGWDNLYGLYLQENLLSVRKFEDNFYVFLNTIFIAEHSYQSFGELFGFYIGKESRVKIDVIGINLMNFDSTKKSNNPKVLTGSVNGGKGQGGAAQKAESLVKRLR